MSIPKEPRQLMINLMYLVLTALLALNVSAEVMNAFFALDKGNKNSSEVVELSNQQVLANIEKQAEAYQSEENDRFLSQAQRAKKITAEFVTFIEDIRKDLFERAGGPSDKDPSKPERIKDKDITTRMFVLGPQETIENDGVGFEIERRIHRTRDSLLALVDYDSSLASSFPLELADLPEDTDKNSWADFTFRQLPVAAVFPILSKMQNDAKTSYTSVLNYLFKKVSGEEIKFDAFQPAVSASKGYIIKGEPYEADIFLSAYSTQAGDNTRIYVNGNRLPLEDGVANYRTVPTSLGTKKYNVRIDLENPLTKEVETFTKTFEYEVGERSVAVSADKMNVFYIGVDNPVSVSAAGVSSNEMQVGVSGRGGATIKRVGSNNFIVNATKPTPPGEFCYVTVNEPTSGLSDRKPFRVKRIPDPVAKLSGQNGGTMGTGEFKAQGGVGAFLEGFDFDANCRIQGFELVYVPKRGDARTVINSGARYTDEAMSLVRKAKPTDTYYFFNVKARCPGDEVGRKINDMVFRIK